MHFYQHNIPDFNNATRHLSRVERSIYRDMIEVYYDTERSLPLDVAIICRKVMARNEEEKSAVLALLDEFFELTEEGYRHARCEEEIMLAREKMDEAVDRRQNERERQRRARARRRELFDQLRAFDEVPAWNTSTEALMTLLQTCQSRQPSQPVTRDSTVTSQVQPQDITQTDTASHEPGTATQYPIPNTQLPMPKEESAKSDARGTRLPKDWKPSAEDAAYCKAERPDLLPSKVAQNFYDYWIAKPGKDGRKTDWSATWRAWVRKENASNALRPGASPAPLNEKFIFNHLDRSGDRRAMEEAMQRHGITTPGPDEEIDI